MAFSLRVCRLITAVLALNAFAIAEPPQKEVAKGKGKPKPGAKGKVGAKGKPGVKGKPAKKGKHIQKGKKPPRALDVLDDPKNAYGWSRYRYTGYDKEPHEQDKFSSMLAGGDVKCDVCEVILNNVLSGLVAAQRFGKGEDAETIELALEADVVDQEKVDKAPSEWERYVEKNKKGCNRLFKDSYLSLGWDIVSCHKEAMGVKGGPASGRVPWACARDLHNRPNETDLNTYSVERESIHYACEATITRHREALAQFLAKRSAEFKERVPTKLAAEACRKAAVCEQRKPTESIEARAKKAKVVEDQHNAQMDKEIARLQKQMLNEL